MVTTANGSPAEGHLKVIVQFVTNSKKVVVSTQAIYIYIYIPSQSSCLHAKVMYRPVYTYSTNNIPGHNRIPLYWKQWGVIIIINTQTVLSKHTV